MSAPGSAWRPPPAEQPGPPSPPPAEQPVPPPLQVTEQSRHGLVLETWFVELAFLVPSVLAAVDVLAAHTGGAAITRFPHIVSNPAANLVLGVLTYFGVAAAVPIALLLLNRTGQDAAVLGWAGRRGVRMYGRGSA